MTNLIKGFSSDRISLFRLVSKIKDGSYSFKDVPEVRPSDIAVYSKYIEPVLLGLKCRPVGVLIDYDGHHTFIDDNRVPALVLFHENEFRLEGLTVAKELNSLTYSELPPLLQGRVDDFQVEMRLLQNKDPDAIEIFRRSL